MHDPPMAVDHQAEGSQVEMFWDVVALSAMAASLLVWPHLALRPFSRSRLWAAPPAHARYAPFERSADGVSAATVAVDRTEGLGHPMTADGSNSHEVQVFDLLDPDPSAGPTHVRRYVPGNRAA